METLNAVNQITKVIIGSAIEVHKALGPGLLESAYRYCLRHELQLRGQEVRHEVILPLNYKGLKVNGGYRLDLLVADLVVVEVKAIEVVLPVYKAELLTYLRLGSWQVGLLINFNVPVLKQGIHRMVLGFKQP